MLLLGFEVPLWSLLLPIALYLAYKYTTRRFDVWEKQGLAGPKPYPLIGTMLKLLKVRSMPPLDREGLEKYGNKWGEFSGSTPQLILGDPELVRIAMIKEFNSMPNRRKVDMEVTLNHFLTVLRDDHWKHVRQSLSPVFTTGKLKQMKPLIEGCVKRLIGHLREATGPVEIKKYCGGFTMDVISSTAFGIEVDSQSNPDSEIIKHANSIMRQPEKNPSWRTRARGIMVGLVFLVLPSFFVSLLIKLGWFSPFDPSAIEFFKSLLGQLMESEKDQPENQGKNFLQIGMENLVEADPSDPETKKDYHGALWTSRGLTKNDLVGNAILFFLAGYETTASTLQYVFFELAHHPEIQQRLYEDIKTHCSTENASYDELAKLTYLDWIIDETLRFYSPAPRFDRWVSSDVEIDGIKVPAESLIHVSATLLHFNPDIWPDPYTFDPERFSPENKQGRHPCAWVPFGVGNRNCIGMRLALLEMKAAIVGVLWNLELNTMQDTLPRPITEFYPNFQNQPKTPIMLSMKAREE